MYAYIYTITYYCIYVITMIVLGGAYDTNNTFFMLEEWGGGNKYILQKFHPSPYKYDNIMPQYESWIANKNICNSSGLILKIK